jgi:hypothetical protein
MKQRTLKYFGMAAMLAVLAACNEINFSGLLNVTEAITFAQSGNSVTVNPGQFQTKASLGQSGSEKQIKLEINNGSNPTKVQISFDKNINIGETFSLTAAQIGQNFDLAGTLATKVENSPEQNGSEYCTYQYPQTVCRAAAKSADETASGANLDLVKMNQDAAYERTTPEASNPVLADETREPQFNGAPMPPPYTPVCNTVWVNRPGTMWTRFYMETTLRDINANFIQAGKNLGAYTGHSSETRKVYTYQSQCR